MREVRRKTLVGVCLASILSTGVLAATITYVGEQLDIVDNPVSGFNSGLRSTSVPKTQDIDGDNAYGTDGNEFFATTPAGTGAGGTFEDGASIKLPAYISDITDVTGGLNRSYADANSWAPTDDPSAAISTTVANVRPGYAYKDVPTGDTAQFALFDIVIADAVIPNTIRVGFFWDSWTADFGNHYLTSLQIQQVVGGAAISADHFITTTIDKQMDGYFFDITGAVAGDAYRVRGRGGASPIAISGLNGITFDSFVPEPASLSLLALGGLALLKRQRKP